MNTTAIYLHGFGSSPKSGKVGFLNEKLSTYGIDIIAPDLNTPSFSNMTISNMVEVIKNEVDLIKSDNIILICSSLGTIAGLNFIHHYSQRAKKITKIILLSPAFDFFETGLFGEDIKDVLEVWQKEMKKTFFHSKYNKELDLDHHFVRDIQKYDTRSIILNKPILLIHGLQDEMIDFKLSLKFAEKQGNINVKLINSDHRLMNDLDLLWYHINEFLDITENIKIISFDLSKQKELVEFDKYMLASLNVLKEAYGDLFYGVDFHKKRLFKDKCRIFIAFDKLIQVNNLIGISYVKPSGKHTAMGVLKGYQRKGVAKSLFQYSFNFFPYQFGEVENKHMKNLMEKLGFKPITSIDRLFNKLKSKKNFVSELKKLNGSLFYKRRSTTLDQVSYDFEMLEKI